MTKKNINLENKDKKNKKKSEQISDNMFFVSSNENMTNSILLSEQEILSNKNKIDNVSLIDLMFLENACALICKRYETIAKLDMINNNKFKEYKNYYELIFSELERRVSNACK